MKRLTLLVSILLTISATSVQAQSENLEENSDLLESSGKYQKAIELDRGQDFGEELRQAFKLFKEAADEGNIDAAYRVATMYQEGRGISINFIAGEKYLKSSAYSGQVDSQIMLASKYMESGNIEEAYFLAILGKALANTQPQFDELTQLLEQIDIKMADGDINRLQNMALGCIRRNLNNCAFSESLGQVDSSEIFENLSADVSPASSQEKEPFQSVEDAEKVLRKSQVSSNEIDPRDVAAAFLETNIVHASKNFEIELGVIGANYASALATPRNQRYAYDAIAQFTFEIDDRGSAKNIFVNYSYGKYSYELADNFSNSIKEAKFPPAITNGVQPYTYYVFFLANTDSIGSIRRVGNKIRSQDRKIKSIIRSAMKAIEKNEYLKVEQYFKELEEQDPFQLRQYNMINLMKLEYYINLLESEDDLGAERTASVPEILNHIDDLISPNLTFAMAVSKTNRRAEDLNYAASLTQEEIIKTLYTNYRLLLEGRRLIEAQNVFEVITGLNNYKEDEFWLKIYERVNEALDSDELIRIEDIIDDDGLAANYLSSDTFTILVSTGNVERVRVHCENQVFEFSTPQKSNEIEIPQESLGCRAFIFGEVGTNYSLIM